jgi:hypothetical protein
MSSKKLNLQTLFGSNKSNIVVNGKLDINTLFKQNIDEDVDSFINPEDLLISIHKKREEVENIHKKLYKKCCSTIMSANNVAITDIYYDIPFSIAGMSEYDPLICLIFIKNKLKDKCILTKIVSKTKIFITWSSIESKLKKN